MTRRTSTTLAVARAAFLGLALAASFAGCEKKKPPPPPAPVVPPPPPPPPKVEVQALLQEVGADARVQFPESSAPTDRTLAEGVIRLADAIARGDSSSMRRLMDRSGQAILDEIVGRADWAPATARIEAVRVAQLMQLGVGGQPTALVTTAIQEPGGAYILNWTAQPVEDSYIFVPTMAAAGVKPRASDWDNALVTASVSLPTEDPSGDLGRETLPQNPGASEPAASPGGRKNTPGGPINIPGGPGGGG